MPLGMRAYSMDLRERIVAAVDAGLPQAQAAERFGVSLRSVERYLSRRRRSGSLAATEQRHGREPKIRRQLQAWLPERLEAAADATLAEHVSAFVAAGGRHGAASVAAGAQPVSLSAMSRAITGLPPAPGDELTPGGRRRRGGRPFKHKACPPPSARSPRGPGGGNRWAGWIRPGWCSSTSAARTPR